MANQTTPTKPATPAPHPPGSPQPGAHPTEKPAEKPGDKHEADKRDPYAAPPDAPQHPSPGEDTGSGGGGPHKAA